MVKFRFNNTQGHLTLLKVILGYVSLLWQTIFRNNPGLYVDVKTDHQETHVFEKEFDGLWCSLCRISIWFVLHLIDIYFSRRGTRQTQSLAT